MICIIPARKNSKRIKNKNIIKFHGKPLISYAIRNAINSKIFSKVIVSTDSQKIANISKKYGAEVPFLRSKNLSNDETTVTKVLKEILPKFKDLKKNKYFCCLYPTSPLIKPKDLISAFNKIKKINADALMSITKFNNHPFRSLIIKKNNLRFLWKKNEKKQSQDLPELYHDAGAFYFYKINKFLKGTKLLLPKKTLPYYLEKKNSVDIDDLEDLKLAEKLFKR